MSQIQTTDVAQLNIFQQVPDAFVWIQVRRIRGQLLQMNGRRPTISKKGFHHGAAVNRRAIPDCQQVDANLVLDVPQELNTFHTRQSRWAHQREQLPLQRDAAHRRQVIISVWHAQHGRLTTWRISLGNSGQQIEAGFINENQGSPLQPGLFFNSGQTSVRQCSMSVSLRWLARSIGFCGVHCNSLRMRETWAGWYTTPNSHSMTFATRAHVHTFPRKPYASAPWVSKSGSSVRCGIVSLVGPPGRGRAYNASTPLASTADIHWLTAPLVTPNTSAISCWLQPACLRSRARNRRASFQSRGDEVVSITSYLPRSEKFSKSCNSQ